MPGNIRANSIESLCSAIVLILALWQSYEAFGALYPHVGLHSYSQFAPREFSKSVMLSSDNKCIGYFNTKFERTAESSAYTIQGEIFLSIQDAVLPTSIDLEASFNVLGQLAAGILQINNNAYKVTLGSLSVDPIELTLLTSEEGHASSRQTFSFPGPLILKDYGEEFELEYPAAKKTIPLEVNGAAVESLLSLKIVATDNVKASCNAGEKGSLDLIKLNAQLRERFASLLSGVPTAWLERFANP